MKYQSSSSERGGIIFFLLIGIVLFAALSVVVSQSLRLSAGDAAPGTSEKMSLALAEIRQVVEDHRNVVGAMVINGIQVKNISAYDATYYPLDNADCTSDACQVYNANGGGLKFFRFAQLYPGLTTVSQTPFVGNMSNGLFLVPVGYYGSGAADLIYQVKVTETFCKFINEKIGITTDVTTTPLVSINTFNTLQAGTYAAQGTNGNTPGAFSYHANEGGFIYDHREGCFRTGAPVVYVYFSVVAPT